jgi:hypothetical protein
MPNDSTTKQIQKYDFHGDTLDVIPDGDRLHVGIRAVCEALGVDSSGQLQRLKRKPWATMGVISAVAEDGKTREMSAVDIRSLPMFPTVRLGDLHCALVRMLHDARKRADIAAPRATQLRLVANENGKKQAS